MMRSAAFHHRCDDMARTLGTDWRGRFIDMTIPATRLAISAAAVVAVVVAAQVIDSTFTALDDPKVMSW